MNKVVYGLLMSALFLGACGSNNAEAEYEYDPFGSTAQQNNEGSSSSSSYTKPSRTNTPSSSSQQQKTLVNQVVLRIKNLILLPRNSVTH